MFNKEETETKQQQLLIRVCIGFGFFLAVVTKNPSIFKGKNIYKNNKNNSNVNNNKKSNKSIVYQTNKQQQ